MATDTNDHVVPLGVLSLLLAVLLDQFRRYMLHRPLPRPYDDSSLTLLDEVEFTLYRVGGESSTYLAHRKSTNKTTAPRRIVVCFPGFLEDMRYFHGLYDDSNCDELLLLNNANYHCPFRTAAVRRAAPLPSSSSWPQNPFPVGSIEHDGFLLAHTLREFVRSADHDDVLLHGHSRGAAVILEAGRQFPAWVTGKNVSVLLEAPQVPGGRIALGVANVPVVHAGLCHLFPLWCTLSRASSCARYVLNPPMWTRPSVDRKTALLEDMDGLARTYATTVVNLRNLAAWSSHRRVLLFHAYDHVTVVCGARDDVLDVTSLVAAVTTAQRTHGNLTLLRPSRTNHFVTLERPTRMREIIARATAAPATTTTARRS